MIDVIFYKGPEGFLGTGIRWWTRSIYSHCELHFGNGECFSSWPGEGTRWTQRQLRADWWDIVPVRGVDGMDDKVRAWCEGELGCKYDWRGIYFSQVFPWGWHSNHRWFCSEVCTAAQQSIGLYPGVKAYQQSPERLHQLMTGA